MARKRRLDYIIGADVTEFEKKANQTMRKIDYMGRKAQRFGSAWTKSLTVPITAAGTAMLKQASDAEEIDSKFRAVFKGQADEVEKWAKSYSRSVGRSTTDNKKFLASIQDTLVPLGFARDNAAEMSKQVVELATDLASFNNLPTEQVIAGIQSAIVGNTETLRQFGVVANQAQIEQEALNLGLIKNKKELDANSKAMAILSLLTKGTTDAQGDAIRTRDSLANQTRGLTSDIKDLSETLGKIMMPTAKEWVGKARDMVQGFSDMNSETQQAIVKWGAIAAAAGPMILLFGKLESGAARFARSALTGTLNLTDMVLLHPQMILFNATLALIAKSMWDFYHASEKTKDEIRQIFSVTGQGGISESVRAYTSRNGNARVISDGAIPKAYYNPSDTKASRDYDGSGGRSLYSLEGFNFWKPEKAKDKVKETSEELIKEAEKYASRMADIQEELGLDILRLQGDSYAVERAELDNRYQELMQEASRSAETRVQIEEWYAGQIADINKRAAMERIRAETDLQISLARYSGRYGGGGMSLDGWTSHKKGENDYADMMDARKIGQDVAEAMGKIEENKSIFDELATKSDLWTQSLADGLANAITGAEDLGDALSNILKQIGTSILSKVLLKGINSIFGFAGGGWIPEPVVGFGASGRMYSFAENKPEYVSNTGSPGTRAAPVAQQSTLTNVHIHINAIDSRDAMEFFTRNKGQVVGIIQENLARNGSVRKAIQGVM